MKNTPVFAATAVGSTVRVRVALIGAALIAMTMLMLLATGPVKADDDDRRGVSGTVMSVGSTSLRVAIKSGLETVFVDANTRIKRGRNDIALSDVTPGDRISASVEPLESNLLLAKKIKVRGKSSVKQIQHLTGVVIERNATSFRLASRNGTSVEIEIEEGQDPPSIADVVTTIVENDLATGRIKAKQIDRVEKIVQRLEASLSKQVDKAKIAVLKKIIDESARQHLDTLNQTLDQVEDEAKEKIGAALTKFRTDYAGVAERVGNEIPEESYEGVIADVSTSAISVASPTGSGSRTFTVSTETVIVLEGTENASTLDLVLGQSVAVSFLPSIDGSDEGATALSIEVLPPALPPIVADIVDELSEDVIQGDITVVEDGTATESDVIIIDEAESGDTIGVEVTEDTEIIVDGQTGTTDELEPGQQVEVTVADDGVTAETVVVTTDEPTANEVSISGIVSGVDAGRRIVVIAPPSGGPLRLEVLSSAVITLNGTVTTLDQIQAADVVLDASRFQPEADGISRLAAVRSAAVEEQVTGASNGNESSGSDPGQSSESPGSSKKQPFSIKGVVKSFSDEFIVFDGMSLPKSSGFSLPEGVSEGSEVDLVFTIAEDGSVILTGIQATE